jgi:dynein heavy chain 1
MGYNEASNVEEWVANLNADIEEILLARLKNLLGAWINEFANTPDELENNHKLKHKLIVKQGEAINFVMDIQIVNQESIMLDPSLEEARAYWYRQLHKKIGIICGQARITSKLYGRADDGPKSDDEIFKSVLGRMGYDENGVVIPGEFNIKQAYETIEATFARARNYYADWRSYQSLWDIDLEHIYSRLGTDVS